MKLINHITRFTLGTFLFIMLVHTLVSYVLVTFFVHKRLERSLLKEKRIVFQAIGVNDSFPIFPGFAENELEIREIDKKPGAKNRFQTVELFSKREEEVQEYFELLTGISLENQHYAVRIRRSLVQTRELIFSLVASSVFSMLLILLVWGFYYRNINRKLWDPFFKSLEYLKKFDFHAGKNLKLDSSNIWEFQQLNIHLNSLSDKLFQDYQGQKHFVENASHELQTPLAVIKTQIELVLQSEHLQKKEGQLLATALDAADRLTKINKSLITLSRIENLQYVDKAEISLKNIIEKNMSIFKMEAESKDIEIIYTALSPCKKLMNDILAHIIVRNLIQNAIRHNMYSGKVWIFLSDDSIEIKNTGKVLDVPTERVFERFYKDLDSEGSIGLGLPIVKEICDLYAFRISYNIEDKLHCFRIKF